MANNLPTPNPGPSGEFILYQTEDGRTKLQVRVEDRTVWLAQRLIAELFQVSVKTANGPARTSCEFSVNAELFQVSVKTANEHLVNIYDEGELAPETTIRKFRIVQTEGSRQVERLVDHYSLNAILAVGYRVRSLRGTQFRQWATSQLRELLVKGFVMDGMGSVFTPKELRLTAQGCSRSELPWEENPNRTCTPKGFRHRQ